MKKIVDRGLTGVLIFVFARKLFIQFVGLYGFVVSFFQSKVGLLTQYQCCLLHQHGACINNSFHGTMGLLSE